MVAGDRVVVDRHVAVGAAADDERLGIGGNGEACRGLGGLGEPAPGGAQQGTGWLAIPRQVGDERVEVLTPEGEVFNDDVEMVSTRTTVGSIGILARHQPLLGMLDPTELRLYKTYGDESSATRFAQGEGYVQVTGDHVLILVEDALAPDALDVSDLQDKLSRAEREASEADEGSEAERKALRDKRRAEAFLRIAQG